jgi:hypothetical protein
MEYEVLPYTAENLAIALSGKDSGTKHYVQSISIEAIMQKNHYNYFLSYFSDEGIGARTIVIEKKYVSKAFLSDYSNYYSTSFKDYHRFGKRLHFFNEAIDQEKFHSEILNAKSGFLQKHYLGYIVVKPLPESIIGATILKTYTDGDDKHRLYHAIREYEINLFGKDLTVESLAYQEQDTVVSACASMAIWNAFHKTAYTFQTALPSPSEITKLAGNLYFNTGRIFPNAGLDLTQIGKAIESVGLVSELRLAKSDNHFAKRFVYAYSKAGLPVLLFIEIFSLEKTADGEIKKTDTGETIKGNSLGHHLITVVGYSEKDEEPELKEEISLKADRIERFYAHDDQIGPFARIALTNSTALETAWTDGDKTGKYNLPGSIYAIIVPVYPKIRISFDDVLKKTTLIDTVLYELDAFQFETEWDIYLSDSNKYKSNVLKSDEFSAEVKERIAFTHYPRYIWVAQAYVKGVLVFDMVFDSTDIARGFFALDFHLIDKDAKDLLKKIFIGNKFAFFDDQSPIRLGQDLYKIFEKELN